MTNQMLVEELSKIGTLHGIDLGHVPVSAKIVEDVYYPQFDLAVRSEAAEMAKHYEVFYSLEKSIRALVSETIEASENSPAWWSSKRVPNAIQAEVASRVQKELDARSIAQVFRRTRLHDFRRTVGSHQLELGHLRRDIQQQESGRKGYGKSQRTPKSDRTL
ncbi:hypothetical protein ACPOL_0101 [Acidisarcina polymorpha]|uniref:Uncharacterized protein n=1 Tax=Acidisarcina polymorpha TaxID=2211140 RepID=A0A2Z5FRZ2_9BACT|nr:hypothetical protein ACPOL_0101 [Acidisarcina polymorpha]